MTSSQDHDECHRYEKGEPLAEKPHDGHVSPGEEDPEGEGHHVPPLHACVSHPLEGQRDVGMAVVAANVVHSLARRGVQGREFQAGSGDSE